MKAEQRTLPPSPTELRAAAKICDVRLHIELLKAAADRIEHLERYATHQPACRRVHARFYGSWNTEPEDVPCTCGLETPQRAIVSCGRED